MSTLCCFVLAIIILLSTNNAYYFVPNNFFWYQADQYCQIVCNSRLASINSQQQQTDIVNTIESRTSPYWDGFNEDPWIGLYYQSPNLIWTDSTDPSSASFTYPWQSDEPSAQATLIDTSSTSYTWYTETTDNLHPFLCNSCDGVLNKYGWINQNSCEGRYNTELAIALDSDPTDAYISINELFDIHGGDAWIGMVIDDINDISTYKWMDGTQYDYGDGYDPTTCVGTCTPWIDNGPDGNGGCVHITETGWNTNVCTDLAFALCNLPSELRTDMNAWVTVSGLYDFVDGQINTLSSGSVDNFAIMADKYWFNGQKDLLIEYRFCVPFGSKSDKYAGIMIFNERNNGCGSYYVTIGKHNEGVDGYYLILYYIQGSSTATLRYKLLDFVWDDDQYYIMLIKVTNGYIFEITINGNTLSYQDTVNANNVLSTDLGSGYIGLYSSSGIATKSKSLYISGSPLSTDTVFDDSTCSFTFNPDAITTLSPTQPTLQPSYSPTLEPIIGGDTGTAVAETKTFWDNFDTITLIVVGMAIWIVLLTLLVGCLWCRKNKKKTKSEDGKKNTYDGVSTQIQITNERNQSFPHNPHNPPPLNHTNSSGVEFYYHHDGNNNNNQRPGKIAKRHRLPSRSTVSVSQMSREASGSKSGNGNGNRRTPPPYPPPTIKILNQQAYARQNSNNPGNNSPNSTNSRYSNYSQVSTNKLGIDQNHIFRAPSNVTISRNNSIPRNNSLPRRRNRLDTDGSFDQIYEKVPSPKPGTLGSSLNTQPRFLDANSGHSSVEGLSEDGEDDDMYARQDTNRSQPRTNDIKEEDEQKQEVMEDTPTRKSGRGSVAEMVAKFNN